MLQYLLYIPLYVRACAQAERHLVVAEALLLQRLCGVFVECLLPYSLTAQPSAAL